MRGHGVSEGSSLRATIYTISVADDFTTTKHNLGTVSVGADGQAVIPERLQGLLRYMNVLDPETHGLLEPVDGERYVAALLHGLHGTRCWAEPA